MANLNRALRIGAQTAGVAGFSWMSYQFARQGLQTENPKEAFADASLMFLSGGSAFTSLVADRVRSRFGRGTSADGFEAPEQTKNV